MVGGRWVSGRLLGGFKKPLFETPFLRDLSMEAVLKAVLKVEFLLSLCDRNWEMTCNLISRKITTFGRF